MRASLIRPLAPLAIVAIGSVAALVSADGPTAKGPPSARLVYTRKGVASVCPDESGLRERVAARLGYDPFHDDASRAIAVTITRDGGGFHAVLEEKVEGGPPRVRRIDSASSECGDLAASIAVALATAIDPLGVGASASASASATASASASAPASAPAPAPASASASGRAEVPASPPAHVFGVLGGFVAFGAAPDLAFGLDGGVGLRWTDLSLALEGRVDAEARAPGPRGGEVKSSILVGTLVPCLHHEVFFGCLLGSVGALRGAGAGVGAPRTDTTFYAAAGVRLGLEIAIADPTKSGRVSATGPFALRATGDVLATLTRTTLRVQDVEAWTTPPVSLLLGVAAVVHFR